MRSTGTGDVRAGVRLDSEAGEIFKEVAGILGDVACFADESSGLAGNRRRVVWCRTGQHAGHEALLLNVFNNLHNCQVPEKRAVSVPAGWLAVRSPGLLAILAGLPRQADRYYRVSETAGHRRHGLIMGGDSYYG